MSSRGAIVTAAAILVAAVLHGAPALAAPPDMPTGDWAEACADADAAYCVESATITPAGGTVAPLSDVGLTASAATAADDWATSLRWSVDGWADQPEDIAAGEVTLVIRTGGYVPRLTTATAGTLRVVRADDGQGHHTLTVTGTATHVDWTTDAELAGLCASGMTCGDDFNSSADQAGTGVRFEGLSLDLNGDPGLAAAMDGTYLATDAQASPRTPVYDGFGADPYLLLGPFGNPQLDATGDPAHNGATAWLPPTYFTAVGTTTDAALTKGFDVVGTSQNGTGSLTATASGVDGGVRLEVPELGFGSALGMLVIFTRASAAAPGQAAPGAPEQVRAMADVSGGARVSWLPPLSAHGSAVTAYRARAYLTATGTMVGSCATTALTCSLGGLTADQSYQVRVSAVSALGEGAAASGAVDRPTPPSAPRTPAVVAGPGRLTLSWAAPQSTGGQPITGYTVRAYRATTGGAPFATCAAPATRLNCTLTGLTSGARVYLSVQASNMAGAGAETARVSGIGWTPASAPRSVTAKSSRGRITVGWAAPVATGGTPLTGYRVELWTAARGGSVAARCTSAATVRTCTTSALTPGRTYYAAVTALNAAGASAQPARVKVTVRR